MGYGAVRECGNYRIGGCWYREQWRNVGLALGRRSTPGEAITCNQCGFGSRFGSVGSKSRVSSWSGNGAAGSTMRGMFLASSKRG